MLTVLVEQDDISAVQIDGVSGTQAGNYSILVLRPRGDGRRVRRLTASTYDDDSRGHDEQGVSQKQKGTRSEREMNVKEQRPRARVDLMVSED